MNMTPLRYISTLLPVIVMTLILSACHGGSGSGKPVVTVSIPPQKYLLEQIAGPGYEVRSLLGADSDPENYEPSMSDLKAAARSLAFMKMGNIGFEERLAERMADINPGMRLFDSSQRIATVEGTHGHGHADPHTWVSVKNSRVIARNLLDAMIAVDPANKAMFEENYRSLDQRLDSLDREVTKMLEPKKGAAFLVWHPSLTYFARDYGLEQIVVGGHEHKELSIPELRRRLDAAAASGARVMVTERGHDSRHTDIVGDVVSVKQVEIAPMTAGWLDELAEVAHELADED